jgi:bifunctional enzyme CysN/CysC
VCEAYRDDREPGGFILIDPLSHKTAAAGIIDFARRRAGDISKQALEVDKARLTQQRPCVLWLTGLSGAGKSTIASLVEKRLSDLGRHTYLLDGDNLRQHQPRSRFHPRGPDRETSAAAAKFQNCWSMPA